MAIKSFEDLTVWHDGKEIIKLVYSIFKNSNEYWLRDQILRASLSITNNIAEGFERESQKEYIRFLFIAKGSTAEVRSILYVAKELEIIDELEANKIIELSRICSGKLLRLINAIKSNIPKNQRTF
jgi:four helix bundle protein